MKYQLVFGAIHLLFTSALAQQQSQQQSQQGAMGAMPPGMQSMPQMGMGPGAMMPGAPQGQGAMGQQGNGAQRFCNSVADCPSGYLCLAMNSNAAGRVCVLESVRNNIVMRCF